MSAEMRSIQSANRRVAYAGAVGDGASLLALGGKARIINPFKRIVMTEAASVAL